MNKKLLYILLSSLMVFILAGCGASTPKLEDKTEKADYTKMQNKQFDSKYTYLENVTCKGNANSVLYPKNRAMDVFENVGKEDFWYTIVVTDCVDNSEIKSRMGSEMDGYKINIKKAEVVPESLGNKKVHPTLLVKQSDIEMIRETEFEDILKSGKSYKEIPDIFGYMIDVKDGKLNYDKEKYSQRVEELLKGYESDSSEMDQEIKEEQKAKENTPQDITSRYKAKYGKVLEASELGKTLTIKLKIDPNLTNGLTIAQNGINVEDLIVNQDASYFDTISYVAVADMTDGSEDKAISFTVDKEVIKLVKNKQIIGSQIIDRAKDLWILPSLKK